MDKLIFIHVMSFILNIFIILSSIYLFSLPFFSLLYFTRGSFFVHVMFHLSYIYIHYFIIYLSIEFTIFFFVIFHPWFFLCSSLFSLSLFKTDISCHSNNTFIIFPLASWKKKNDWKVFKPVRKLSDRK